MCCVKQRIHQATDRRQCGKMEGSWIGKFTAKTWFDNWCKSRIFIHFLTERYLEAPIFLILGRARPAVGCGQHMTLPRKITGTNKNVCVTVSVNTTLDTYTSTALPLCVDFTVPLLSSWSPWVSRVALMQQFALLSHSNTVLGSWLSARSLRVDLHPQPCAYWTVLDVSHAVSTPPIITVFYHQFFFQN